MNKADDVEDDLQGFIADCEYTTRKILRESNRRMHDNSRALSAKDRVENGSKRADNKPGSAKETSPPTMATKTSSLKNPVAPVKEWKGRDKIIHDVCETIKSFPAVKNTSATIERPQQATNAHAAIHSSLATSPFNCGIAMKNRPPRLSTTTDDEDDDDDVPKNIKPSMVTLRTIERDLYAMSKKYSNAPPKRQHYQSKNQNDLAPELKPSVLRKKYRCDERVMMIKKKRAERLLAKFKRLKLPKDESELLPTNDDGDDDSSKSSSDYENCSHVIHDLLEKHVAEENSRSQKLYAKTQDKPNAIISVKDAWARLEHNNGKLFSIDGQVQSVPLHIATKNMVLNSDLESFDPVESRGQIVVAQNRSRVIPYVCPYKKPEIVKLQLVVNEPLVPESDRGSPLDVSVSVVRTAGAQVWLYEFYEPCNGNITRFFLSDGEFDLMNKALQLSIPSKPQVTLVDKIVHHQVAPFCGVECTFVIWISVNESNVNVIGYRSSGVILDRFERMRARDTLVFDLHACEVLQLLRKNHAYSALDVEFWLRDSNGASIWKPLIDTFTDTSAISADDFTAMAATKKAYRSMLSLRTEFDRSTCGGAGVIFDIFRQRQSFALEELSAEIEHVAPLSTRIVGSSPYSNTICPGYASVGKRGVWSLSKPFVDENPYHMLPNWSVSSDIRYPACKDRSQATAFFRYKSFGSQKGNSVSVLSSMALESPVLAPFCYAMDKGYISPPLSEHEQLSGDIPHVDLPCVSLLKTPLQSRFDTLLPPPIIVLDPSETEDDWKDAPTDADGNVYHLRGVDEYNNDGFRVKTFTDAIEIDCTISSMAFGISETAASPNRPTLSPVASHKSDETCSYYLSRKRTAADYHYIAESEGEGTSNEPCLFITHMSAYNSVFVSRKSVSTFREHGHFLRAAEEVERNKMELSTKMKAAEELVKERLVKAQEALLGRSDSSTVIDITLDVVGDSIFTNEAEKNSIPMNEGDELEKLVSLLLRNTNFLKGLARKLSIPEEHVMQLNLDTNQRVGSLITSGATVDSEIKRTENSTIAIPDYFPTVSYSETQAKLSNAKLDCKIVDTNDVRKGNEWKKLPRSEAVVGDFSLAKRNMLKGSGRPKLNDLEEKSIFISLNTVKELRYQPDPRQFDTEPKPQFISDLTKERLRLAESYRLRKKAKDSMLNASQQRSLDEILHIPVSEVSDNVTNDIRTIGDCVGMNKGDACQLDHVARAILAVKNFNLQELEQVLNTDDISIETRDQHGNTLFILACQQGSKKLARFLLKRGADMNAQNYGGNSSLHYLYEYKHTSLAEYLIEKGANDGMKNGLGRTCYEGIGADEEW